VLSPVSFAQVRISLVKRTRRMAQLKSCIASGLGYLRSAAALMPLDELPGYLGPDIPASRILPDLLSTAIWFVDKAQDYDHKKGRVHAEEVLKKRLGYGYITAQQVEEERRLHGVELAKEDWVGIDRMRKALRHSRGKRRANHDDWLESA
jgi:hypothetical protein